MLNVSRQAQGMKFIKKAVLNSDSTELDVDVNLKAGRAYDIIITGTSSNAADSLGLQLDKHTEPWYYDVHRIQNDHYKHYSSSYWEIASLGPTVYAFAHIRLHDCASGHWLYHSDWLCYRDALWTGSADGGINTSGNFSKLHFFSIQGARLKAGFTVRIYELPLGGDS